MARHSTIVSFILIVAATQKCLSGVEAVEYIVKNNAAKTAGGIRFDKDLGAEYTKKRMADAINFIWRTFQQTSEADKKKVARVSLIVDEMDGIAHAWNDQIHVGDKYIQGIKGDIKWDFSGVLYHEMTHIWQWDGSANTKAPGELIEGIADFVRLKADYAPASWARPGEGDRWNQGYSVTARFLEFCDELREGFVAELNKKLRITYSDDFFVELLGKTADRLWHDYKAKYGKL